MSDLQRIQADLAKCKQHIAEMEAGTRGGITSTDPGETPEAFRARNPHAGGAFENQLKARRTNQERLENELAQAMLAEHKWAAGDVIAAMARPKPEDTDSESEPGNAGDAPPLSGSIAQSTEG